MSSWIMASRNQHGEGNTSLLRPGKWDSEMMKNTSTDPLLGAALYHAACKLLTRGRALMKNRKGGKKNFNGTRKCHLFYLFIGIFPRGERRTGMIIHWIPHGRLRRETPPSRSHPCAA